MKRITIACVVVGFLATPIPAVWAQAPPKIGVFDADRLSQETTEGKRIQTDLTTFRDRKQSELGSKEKELADLQNQLNAQSLSLSAEKRGQIEKDIQRKMLDLNQSREAATREFQLELNEAQGKFQEQLFGVIDRFARDEGFSLIFERSQVAFVAEGVDITTALVDSFNRLTPAPAGSPAGAAPVPGTPPTPPKPGPGGGK